MFYESFVREVKVGDTVRFVYHGKEREGVVERMTRPFVVVQFNDSGRIYYKSFNYFKMSGLKNLSVV